MRLFKCYGKKLIMKELKKSYNFFINEANTNKNSLGYGLIRDKTLLSNNIASIASVGYGLAALVIGVEHKWITYNQAFNRVNRTLDTFINNVEDINGFYYHFLNIEDGTREWNCEISIIDTAIFICGALTAGEYFGGIVKEKADFLYKKINWEWYRNKDSNYFYMGYTPESGFWGHWDMYAEQLMLYILGVGSPTFPINTNMYYDFQRKTTNYNNINEIIYTYCGTLFTYSNRQYCIDNKLKFKTYGENSWGLTSCLGPNGYCAFGSEPCDVNLNTENDGTVTPCGAIGSIVFTPKESIQAMEFYYNNFPKLWGKYGFKDGYNLDGIIPWFANEYIGIDKGIGLLMIENYLTGGIWKYFMKNQYVKDGLNKLEFRENKNKIYK